MDTISQNKNIVTSFIDALFTKGDLGAVDEYLAGDYVDHDPPMGFPASREGMRAADGCLRRGHAAGPGGAGGGSGGAGRHDPAARPRRAVALHAPVPGWAAGRRRRSAS